MIEPFQKNGQWWIPDQEKKVPGILTFDPTSGISVSLFQPLNVEFARLHVSQSPIIHGVVDGLVKISLLDCHEVLGKTKIAHEIHSSSKIGAGQCVIGAHLCGSTRFNDFQLSLHNYAQFVCRSGIRSAMGHDAGYTWDRVEPIEFEIAGDKVSISINVQAPISFFELSARIEESATISIVKAEPVADLDEVVLGTFRHLRSMLEFSLGYPVPITQFQASVTDSDGQKKSVEIFFSQSSRATDKIGNPHHDMLFAFCKRSNEEVKALVAKWASICSDNQLTIDAIINSGVRGFGDKRPEQSFLFLISSLEALQRNFGKLKLSMPEEKFKELKDLVFSVLPKNEFGNYIRNGVGRLIDPGLPKRLGDVLDLLPQNISERIVDKRVLIENLVKTRTLVAHHINRMEKKYNVLIVWHLTQVLWGITVVYVLLLLGFSDEEVDSIVKNKISLLNALHWLEEVSNPATKL